MSVVVIVPSLGFAYLQSGDSSGLKFGVRILVIMIMMYARTEMIYVVLIVASFLTEGAQATHQVRAPIGNPLGMYIFFFPLWCSVRLIVKMPLQ